MDSRKGKGIAPEYGHSYEGFGSDSNSPKLDQQNQYVADLNEYQDDKWEVVGKKSRNRSTKQWGSSTASPKAWGHQVSQKPSMAHSSVPGKGSGRGNTRSQGSRAWESSYMAPPPAAAPPLQRGWQWGARTGKQKDIMSNLIPQGSIGEDSESDNAHNHSDDVSDADDLGVDTDDDTLNDDYDSDASQKSHETRKNTKWFRKFFEALGNFTIEQINDTMRQWHCPACQNGPGSIDWYKGLQPLMSHAKTKRATRVKLHREFSQLLDEELQRRGASVIPAGEAFGKWKGLHSTVSDHDIVWPPMVVIMNTRLEKDENDKWIGMGNQELVDYFSSYDAVKARHSYGPQGHRGMSVLIFEGSLMGYLEAERLDRHFSEQRMDREAWERHPVLFYQGGQRQLYGYMACKKDLDCFNQHSQGKSKLKFEMRSYQEMVVGPMKQMSEDNQLLTYYKNKVVRQQQRSRALEETVGVMSRQLRIANEENRIVRQRTQIQHEENKEEMDSIEQFFKEKVAIIHVGLEDREDEFEKSLQEQLEKAKQSNAGLGSTEEWKLKKKEIEKFILTQSKDIEEFEAEREEVIRAHERKKNERRRKYLEEEVELEREFKEALTQLMESYAPPPP
ncbi:protein SUPPRESSOR OF GENE SILENCING 3 homolog [Tasmannia lanceolata]|uniref:protein SUPPRESSOR OF GENE SILENCING 3 homolog n=1 Tax=Tasmannia lanceolata TaxID=3420 RepID=UPI0040643EB2